MSADQKQDTGGIQNMKKDLGIVDAVYPMPVLMVAAYDANGKVNVMNVAWGQIADEDKIILFIGEGKKTWLNIMESKAFTVALADEAHMDVADFFGIASGNRMTDKFEKTGYHAVRSDRVNAPIIEEFPVVMECELLEHLKDEYVSAIVGRIVNVKANEEVLDERGKVDVTKLHALMFDQFRNGYYATGEKVGQAWNAGKDWMK
jgi:flavin reductase (DIM6/NTAB) family NADH-FMN oxidoreductase RutF